MGKIVAIVRADRIYLASLFQSMEETRYYLGGVFIHSFQGGVNLAGTDGHTMAVFREQDGFTAEDFIVRLSKDCVAAIKSNQNDASNIWFVLTDQGSYARRRAYLIRHVLNDEKGLLETISSEINETVSLAEIWSGVAGVIDGTYPEYLKVIPKIPENARSSAAYQPKYIKRFSQVAEFGNRRMVQSMSLIAATPATPVICKIDNRDDFVGVLMPVSGTRSLEMPQWAQRKEPEIVSCPPVPEKTQELAHA